MCRHGIRFGGGIYSATSSSKYVKLLEDLHSLLLTGRLRAYEYAKNINKGSKYRVMTVTRVVPGRVQKLHRSEPMRLAPDPGYDSVRLVVVIVGRCSCRWRTFVFIGRGVCWFS